MIINMIFALIYVDFFVELVKFCMEHSVKIFSIKC